MCRRKAGRPTHEEGYHGRHRGGVGHFGKGLHEQERSARAFEPAPPSRRAQRESSSQEFQVLRQVPRIDATAAAQAAVTHAIKQEPRGGFGVE